LKTDLAALYVKAGQKGIGTVFLMTDSQVADEKFLVLINDMLASGEIPNLFPDDAIEEIIGAMRNEVKSAGIDDTRENIWKYFIEKVRRNLKVNSTVDNRSRLALQSFDYLGCAVLLTCRHYTSSTITKIPRHYQLYLDRLVS
jgi:hypothetical protein